MTTETQAKRERLDEMRLAEILARSDGATAGPWIRSGVRRKMRDEDCVVVGQDGFMIIGLPIGRGSQQADALRDAEFIAHAREDVPYLLALLTRQQEALDWEKAHSAEAAKEVECLLLEIERLTKALQDIADGGVPVDRTTLFRSDGILSKNDKCRHGTVAYEDCGECVSDFARAALQARP